MLSGAGAPELPPHPATLSLASTTLPAVTSAGITMTPIGLWAAFTALNAFTIPVPH